MSGNPVVSGAEITSPFEKLNDDCLWMIFGYLSQKEWIGIERVCKRWREVCLWSWSKEKTIDIEKCSKSRDFDLARLECLLKRGGAYVRNLDFTRNSCSPPDIALALGLINKYCNNLTSLNLSKIKLTQCALETISDTVAVKLESLSLNSCNLKDEILSPLLKKSKNLQKLSIYENVILGDSLLNLTENCVSLSAGYTLSIAISRFMAGKIIEKAVAAEEIIKRIPNVVALMYHGFPLKPKMLLRVSKNLTELSLRSNEDFWKDDNYKSLSFPQLKVLDLCYVKGNDDILQFLAIACPKLEKLYLDEFGKKGNISTSAFKPLSNFKYLTALSLRDTAVNNEVFENTVLSSNGRFQDVNCRNCNEITTDAVCRAIGLSPNLKRIHATCKDGTSLKQLFDSAFCSVNLRTNKIPLEIYSDFSGIIEDELDRKKYNEAIGYGQKICPHPMLKILLRPYDDEQLGNGYLDINHCDLLYNNYRDYECDSDSDSDYGYYCGYYGRYYDSDEYY